jgi:hypothetical protein
MTKSELGIPGILYEVGARLFYNVVLATEDDAAREAHVRAVRFQESCNDDPISADVTPTAESIADEEGYLT